LEEGGMMQYPLGLQFGADGLQACESQICCLASACVGYGPSGCPWDTGIKSLSGVSLPTCLLVDRLIIVLLSKVQSSIFKLAVVHINKHRGLTSIRTQEITGANSLPYFSLVAVLHHTVVRSDFLQDSITC
jgi:hypothetical protein